MRLRRRRAAASIDARATFRDPAFECRLPGVSKVQVDYDPAVWVRPPRVGVDRTEWASAYLEAFVSDLDLPAGDVRAENARRTLEIIADQEFSHTVDLVSLSVPPRETGIVAFLNVVDEELGLLEHGDPEVFLSFGDLGPGLGRPQRTTFPNKRDPRAWQTSVLQALNDALQTTFHMRAYRREEATEATPTAHLYATAFYSRPESVADVLHLLHAVLVVRP